MTTYYAIGPRLAVTATDWFHGTTSREPFSRFDFSQGRQDADPSHTRHWNSRIGSHFTTIHKVAEDIAMTAHDGHHVYHADLDLKNPKHYDSEKDLDREAHDWAKQQGHTFTSLHDGEDAEQQITRHPKAQEIAEGFRQHLQAQGHDGITYGNEYEGPRRHKCSIIFHPDQAKITHTHNAWEECEETNKCPECGHLSDKYADSCEECRLPFRYATAFFRTAAQPTEWFHGSGAAFDRFDFDKQKTVQTEDVGRHWNSHLGAHFSSDHRVSQEFAKRQGGGHVYHAQLDMKNPKHYESEYDLDHEAYHWAKSAEHDIGLPDEWMHDTEPDEWSMYISYDNDNKPNDAQARDIAHGFREHLKSQGHDGITYGNELESSHNGFHAEKRHVSAIAFHPDQIKITQRHGGAEPCQRQASATAFFKQAYDAPEGGTHGRADHPGADRPGGRGRTAAQAGNGRRPQPGQPERAARQGRRVRAAAEVEHHPELQGDLDRLGGGARHVQDTITALQHGQGGVSTYPLSHPLDGWHAAITTGGHQVVHRHDPDTKTLHVGYAGHNIADAEQRLGTSGGGEGSALPVEFHKGAEKDFDKLHPEVQDKVLDTIDRLSRGEVHQHDHSLHGTMSDWRSARADFLNRVTHRYEDHHGSPTSHERAARLFVGHVGPHNYEDAIKRLTSLTDFFREPRLQQTAGIDSEGHQVELDPIDGWQHADGSVSHDDGSVISDRPVQMTEAEEQMLRRQAAAVNNDDGVMVAIVPPRGIAEELAREGGQPVDDLHITLAYLGDASDYTPEQLKLLPQIVGAWAVRQKPVCVRIGGVGKFNNSHKGQHVLWASADIPGGAQMHSSLAFMLEGHGYRLPSEHGWLPHLTLAYVTEHFRFMPRIDEYRWEASEVVTYVRGQRYPARFGGRPITPTTL